MDADNYILELRMALTEVGFSPITRDRILSTWSHYYIHCNDCKGDVYCESHTKRFYKLVRNYLKENGLWA